jgi:hypothetical protein
MAVIAPGFFSVADHLDQLPLATLDAILIDHRSKMQGKIPKLVVLGPW